MSPERIIGLVAPRLVWLDMSRAVPRARELIYEVPDVAVMVPVLKEPRTEVVAKIEVPDA